MVRPVRTRTISGREATGSRFLSCRPACGEISCSFECVLCSATAWPDLYSPETRVRREKTLQIVSTVVRDKTVVTRDARDHARETERPQRDSGRARGARVQPCTVVHRAHDAARSPLSATQGQADAQASRLSAAPAARAGALPHAAGLAAASGIGAGERISRAVFRHIRSDNMIPICVLTRNPNEPIMVYRIMGG